MSGGLVLAESGNLAILRTSPSALFSFVDVARGRLLRSAEAEAAAEVLPFGASLVVRRAAIASLGVLPASGPALSKRHPTVVSLGAGQSAMPDAGPLPLLAAAGGSFLAANPMDRRIYAVMPAMVAPHASFPLPSSTALGLFAADRSLKPVGRDRLEGTIGGLDASEWQLVLARAGGGALCRRFRVVGPERAGTNRKAASRFGVLKPVEEEPSWRLRLLGFLPGTILSLSAGDSSGTFNCRCRPTTWAGSK